MTNHWGLSQSEDGWEEVARSLDLALETAITAGHLARANGESVADARRRTRLAIWPLMREYSWAGADDSEPHRYLERRIEEAFGP